MPILASFAENARLFGYFSHGLSLERTGGAARFGSKIV
jgi:hypothetical protein